MADKSVVIREVMANKPAFRDRVTVICGKKANTILQSITPDAGELAWAKTVVAPGYDAWTESLLILEEAQLATTDAAYAATDAQFASFLDTVLPAIILAKGLGA